jgi:hypothetical protein
LSGVREQQVSIEDLKQDFCLFLAYVWQYLQLPPPTPKQMEMAKWLAEGTPDMRQILMAFRGVGKSWITAVFVVWCLWNNPEEKILVISASGGRSVSFSLMCQRLISEIEFLKHLKPASHQEQHRWSKVEFDVGPTRIAQSPSVKSVGVNGQITGSRATIIILDDVEVPENSYTVDAREKLMSKVLEIEAIIMPNGRIVFLGTPQTEESIYKTLREKGYTTRIWPARVPSEEKLNSYHGCLAPSIANLVGVQSGRPTDTRFTNEDLAAREGRWGRSGFALQFMLDTSLSDCERYPLKTADLLVSDYVDPDFGPSFIKWSRQEVDKGLPHIGFSGDRWYKQGHVPSEAQAVTPYEGRIMFIDPSGRGADECVAIVVYQLHGKLFVADMEARKDGYGDATLVSFSNMAKRHKVNTVVIEANFGDGMFTKLLQPVMIRTGHRCRFEEVKHSIQKEKRIIDTLEPVLNQHRLVVDRKLIEKDLKLVDNEVTRPYSLFYQLTRVTKERGALRHDDRLDALAGAVAYWVEAMGRDHIDAHEDYLESQKAASIEEFLEYVDHLGGQGNTSKVHNPFGFGLQSGWLGSY